MTPHTSDRFQVARFLRMQPWFGALPPLLQDRVTRQTVTLQGTKGEVMLAAGEQADGWYAVLSGFVKLQAPVEGQVSAYLALTGGEWFGEGTAMKQEPRRYEVLALRDSELLCVPTGVFQELLRSSLPFSHAVLENINMRLGQAMAIIASDRTRSVEQRVALYLGPLFWHGLRKLNLSQEELGNLAGISRQTANRALKELAARGLVTVKHGRVVATDQEALARFCQLSAPRAPACDVHSPPAARKGA